MSRWKKLLIGILVLYLRGKTVTVAQRLLRQTRLFFQDFRIRFALYRLPPITVVLHWKPKQ